MKLPWKREPTDLVGEQVAAAQARADAYPSASRPVDGGTFLLPEGITFPGDSVSASGGWCAPSEAVYDHLTTVLNANGSPAAVVPMMLSIPEVQVRRGGMHHPRIAYDRKTAHPYPNPAFLAASGANRGLLPMAFLDATRP